METWPIGLTLVAIVLSVAYGCEDLASEQSKDEPVAQPDAPAVVRFHSLLESSGAVVFRSWNGKALRKDSDNELIFLIDGRVANLEHGYSSYGYWGNFKVSPNGRISTQFKNYPAAWPDMKLDLDGEVLLLRPASGDSGFVMGGRGATYFPSGQGTYWPFRMLEGSERAAVIGKLNI